MAIFHCQMQKLTRGKGKSAVAAAAYRSGEKFTNEYDGVTHNYSSRKDVVYSEIILPDNAPPEFQNRATLWNAVEKKEKSKNAVLAREFDIALPIELNREEQIILIREYVKAVFVDDGMCADISIHDKNDGNPHAHVMLTCRPFSSEENKGDGVWGDKEKKNRLTDKDGNYIYDTKTKKYKCGKSIKMTTWDTFEFVPKCRERWAHFANQALERAGHDVRISHESLEAQGITDRKPQKHLGAIAAAMERRGEETEIGNYNRFVEADYHERLVQDISNIEKAIRETQAEKPAEIAVREVPPAPIAQPSTPKPAKPTQPVVTTKPKPKKEPRVELEEVKKEIAKLCKQIVDVDFRYSVSYGMERNIEDMERNLTGWKSSHYNGLLESFFEKRKYKRQMDESVSQKREYDTETAKIQRSNDKIEARIEKLEVRKVKLEDETGITAAREAREREKRLEAQRQREENRQLQQGRTEKKIARTSTRKNRGGDER